MTNSGSTGPMQRAIYEDGYVQALFDRMGPTYDLVNFISSFGFSEVWRRRCVLNGRVWPGARVCDMMSGSGECWRYVRDRGGSLISVDFSRVMAQRQAKRKMRFNESVDVRCENALQTSIESESVDCVISAFGLKTLSPEALMRFALEIRRILKPEGRISLLEISTANSWWLSPVYRWYVNSVIPIIGKICLGDMDSYSMLGTYTQAFGSTERIAPVFVEAGFDVSVHHHFHGCATSLVGSKKNRTHQAPRSPTHA
jgi:demethylmenaquinone methyltransferase/2-methoxy-6-polyprenyl-1,4-benzoquinol methylase